MFSSHVTSFYLVGFGFGYYFIATDGLKFTDMFICVLCITSSAQAASVVADGYQMGKGQVAAAEMFEIIDRIPKSR